jgi:hypothetical protein
MRKLLTAVLLAGVMMFTASSVYAARHIVGIFFAPDVDPALANITQIDLYVADTPRYVPQYEVSPTWAGPYYKSNDSVMGYSSLVGALGLDWTRTNPGPDGYPGTVTWSGTDSLRLEKDLDGAGPEVPVGTVIDAFIFDYTGVPTIGAGAWTLTLTGYAGDYAVIPSYWGYLLGNNVWYLEIYAAPPVPVPAALWLLGSGLIGLIALRKRK